MRAAQRPSALPRRQAWVLPRRQAPSEHAQICTAFPLQDMRREHLAHLPVVGGRVANDHAPAAASNGHSPAHLSICGCFRPARRGPILVAVLMRVATVVVRVVAECASKQQCKHYELMSNVLELCFHGLPAYVHLYISQHVFHCSSLLGCLLIPSSWCDFPGLCEISSLCWAASFPPTKRSRSHRSCNPTRAISMLVPTRNYATCSMLL